MGAKAIGTKDPGAVAFFMSNLCSEADLVYRFCYTALLNEDKAQEVVKDTFRSVASQIRSFLDLEGHDIRYRLMCFAWEKIIDRDAPERKECDTIAKEITNLSLECRCVLIAVDVLGMSATEARTIFNMKEHEISLYLAEGRKALLAIAS